MPMYNLIQYSCNYSKTSGSLWHYCKDELNNNLTDSGSFKSKIKITENTSADVNTKGVEKIVPSLQEKKNLRLTKICEKDRKDHISVSFCIITFHGNINFFGLSFKRKCKKSVYFFKSVFLRKYESFVCKNCM